MSLTMSLTMSLSSDQRLFSSDVHLPTPRQLLWRGSLLLSVLGLNSVLSRLTTSVGWGLGLGLLVWGGTHLALALRRLGPRMRWSLTMVWALGGFQALLLGGGLSWLSPSSTGVSEGLFGLRLLTALTWLLWFGATTPWPALKEGLRRLHLPADVLLQLKLLITHGLSLARSLKRRLSAARVRHAYGEGRPLLKTNGQVLAGGVLLALDRALQLERARQVRSGNGWDSPVQERSELELTPSRWAWRPEIAWHGHPTSPQKPLGLPRPTGLALRLEQVSAYHADRTPALQALNLELPVGGWVVLAGPSGSGKSSLLGLLAGLLTPEGGPLERLGQRVPPTGPKRFDPRVSLVFQAPEDQLFGATPLEDLLWGLEQHGVPLAQARKRALELLEGLGLAPLAHRPLHRLSYGEQKRVSFAAALVTRPALLLCDEPTSGLDPVAAQLLISVLEQVTGVETSVIWATHELNRVPSRTSHVWLLREGRCVRTGEPSLLHNSEALQAAGLWTGHERVNQTAKG